jgi:hypothetical protein
MANESKTFFERFWKQILGVITVVFLVFYVAVFSSVWGDRNYASDFWPDFFKWSAIVIGGGMAIIWAIGYFGKRKK